MVLTDPVQIAFSDRQANHDVDILLNSEGIRRDKNLDYTCGVYAGDTLIATGSCWKNTLRCIAVDSAHRGEGLVNSIITDLIQTQYRRGNTHLFLYTKCSTEKYFCDMGFYEIARIPDSAVFMENRRNGFADYLASLGRPAGGSSAAIVMNANPFTLGHRYLIEKAASENKTVHLFFVSEDESLIPAAVRRSLVQEGIKDLKNVILHDSGDYIISNATFPSYFQKDESSVIESHAGIDVAVFTRIAQTLGIKKRYAGEEPFSKVTGIYNTVMQTELPKAGIQCIIIPRKEADGRPVSASDVRECIKNGDMERLSRLVPPSTFRYFLSSESEPVRHRICSAENIIHY